MASEYKFHKVFLIVFVITGLLLPLWGMRYSIDMDWKTEKRKLAEKKAFQKKNLFEYRDSYERYFNDNFGYRRLLIYDYNFMLYKIFNQSPLPKNVILGDDDWMFYYSAPELLKWPYFTPEELVTIKNNLEKRQKYFEKLGIKFYVILATEKVNIYNQYFPGFDPARHTSHKLDQLDEYLKKQNGFRIINPTNSLKENKDKYIIYYKQDSHWNDLGAFFAYSDLIKRIKLDFSDIPVKKLSDYKIIERENEKANLAAMIGIDTTWKTGPHLEPLFTPESEVINKYKHNEEEFSEIQVKQNKNTKLPRILVFRDSYGEFMIPYISESFSRSVFVFSSYIDENIVQREKPDIVVYEITEGRINLLLKY